MLRKSWLFIFSKNENKENIVLLKFYGYDNEWLILKKWGLDKTKNDIMRYQLAHFSS